MAQTVKTATFLRLLGLFIAVVPVLTSPAMAAGPLDEAGEVDAQSTAWLSAEPGRNPMSVDEAIAAMGLLLAEMETCNLNGAKDFNLVALRDDIVAGGSDMADFKPGSGKHSPAVIDHKERFTKKYKAVAHEWGYICSFDPYRSR